MNPPISHNRTLRTGFTLTELLVAIGAVSVLTVGIGRVVASINDIVARGGAIEEVQASARAIEQIMRRDFELLNQMSADETYIAIRSQELGSPTRPIYHDEDDRRADRQAGVTPYSPGSRAITRRLDEIVFIAGDSNESNFVSKQVNGFYSASQTSASRARIYYGHGLKPKPYNPDHGPGDPYPEWPARDPADRYPNNPIAPRVPPRVPEPDGYFGDPPATNDPSKLTSINRLFGRNQYANSWALARQPILLAGSEAMGSSTVRPTPPVGVLGWDFIVRDASNVWFTGTTLGVAPTLLDRENFNRWWDTNVASSNPLVWDLGPGQGESTSTTFPWAMPVPRMIRHGSVDIVAQSHLDLRNWVEGEPPPSGSGAGGWTIQGDNPNSGNNPSPPPLHGSAYSTGGWLANTNTTFVDELIAPVYGTFAGSVDASVLDHIQSPLWSWGDKNPTVPVDHTRMRNNLAQMRTALASTIVRPIVEPDAKLIDRTQEWDNLDAPLSSAGFMDNHAVISARCSNFEIAWTDGSRLRLDEVPLDLDGDSIPEYLPGDLIWFDISRVRPDSDANNTVVNRQTMHYFVQSHSTKIDWGGNGQVPVRLNLFGSKPSEHGPDFPIIPEIPQFILPGFSGSYPINDEFGNVETTIPPTNLSQLRYNPELLGSTPSSVILDGGTSGQSDDLGEMLTIWPFRKLAVVQDNLDEQLGRPESAWPKPRLIRVRMTLHDRGNLLKKGKEYEFIFNINLKSQGLN
ncbi:MAG: type II secretion system protein J [Phycisphaerales bacterium JB043]